MNDHAVTQAVTTHYSRQDLANTIFAALRAAGKDPEHLTLDDLSPLDQLHTGGKSATLELARLAGVSVGQRVLDVGGGLGGAARVLAATSGCIVTVLELSEVFCAVGKLLTGRTGLADRVTFQQGNALAMPFTESTFDMVWMQHASMNIADKEGLYAEIVRILKPGGRFVLHEVMAGEPQPIHFPVPWADDATTSFLRSPDDARAALEAAGLHEIVWQDTTERAHLWHAERMPDPSAPLPPLGLHVIFGTSFGRAFGHQVRNLGEGRTRVIMAVLEK